MEDALGKLTNTELTWEDLQRRPLPDGVNPLKLETYLSQEEFEVRHLIKRTQALIRVYTLTAFQCFVRFLVNLNYDVIPDLKTGSGKAA